MKLALGTVQFGLDYGISNTQGITPSSEVEAILDYASLHGVTVLDTAPLYGNSERILGDVLKKGFGRIVSKTTSFPNETLSEMDGIDLKKTFNDSLLLLQQSRIHGLLIHHADDLLKPGGENLFYALQNLKLQGLVDKIGVSVYTKEQIDKVLDAFPLDIVQLPINILDQRLLKENYLNKIKQKNIEIHARSVFLQGLLLMDHTALPDFFRPAHSSLVRYSHFIVKHGLTPVQAALGFVCSLDAVDYVVCGVNTLVQWQELVAAAQVKVDSKLFEDFSLDDNIILNPPMWEV